MLKLNISKFVKFFMLYLKAYIYIYIYIILFFTNVLFQKLFTYKGYKRETRNLYK